MTKQNTNAAAVTQSPVAPTPQDKAKASKWFEHGKAVAETHNYEYAIECYINGLAIWPDAVDEGHKPLRAVAFARLGAGKGKPGIFAKLKFSRTGRDPLQAMLNAERLLAKDPNNIDFQESMLKSAAKLGLSNTCLWLAPIVLEQAAPHAKSQHAKLLMIRQVCEELGDRFNERGDLPKAVESYQLGVQALEAAGRIRPDDGALHDQVRNLSGKLTIAKGKFESGDFRESLHDADKQRELHDKDKFFTDQKRLDELIEAARRQLEATPNEPGKVFALVDLLLRRSRAGDEDAAIQLLLDTYNRSRIYQFKVRADEVRMRQFVRQARQVQEQGDRQAAVEHLAKQLEFEIAVYKERIQQYPTDARLRYELGRRYFLARRYDEAIPVLQQARSDPKHRIVCLSLLAQCFYHKGFHDQAINILNEAIRAYELVADETSKELHYWLGRAQEAANQKGPAAQTYGQIIQWDYNYRDVRKRLEELQGGAGGEPGPGA